MFLPHSGSWFRYGSHHRGISFVHSRLDYCNSMYYCLPQTQLNRLQHIQNALARAVVAVPRSCHAEFLAVFSNRGIGSRYMNALNTKLSSLCMSSRPPAFSTLPAWSHYSTVFSMLDPLDHLHWSLFSVDSSLKITDCSLRYASPHLWNRLPPLQYNRVLNCSSCSLSVRSCIVTQLFSIVILWSWTACWPFSWYFLFSS